MSEAQQTALYDFHVKNGARMVPFAGWDMPVQYSGIIEEHTAVREAAGLFDVSHMGECTVEGAQAAAFLDYACTNNIANLKHGQARYTLLCQPDGGCVDDIIVYRRDESRFFICLNASNAAKDIAWLQEHSQDYDCTVTDVCANWAQLALQGPKAEAMLQPLTDTPLGEIGFFHFVEARVAQIPVIISRTGYTGEQGFELYVEPPQASALAEKLLETGTPLGLKLAGLGARDSLRLEAGYPLYGHEISETISPLQAKLGWAVKLKKESNFIGRPALKQEKANGVQRTLVFFKLNDRRIARAGTDIVAGEEVVGMVVSGTHSPSLGCPIGSALVKTEFADTPLQALIRNKHYPLETVKPPFIVTSLSQ